MKRKNITYFPLIILLLVVTIGAGCQSTEPTENQQEPIVDRDAILQDAKENGLIMDSEEMDAMMGAVVEHDGLDGSINPDTVDFSTWNSGALADVTGGGAYGIARSTVENGQYKLFMTGGGLPEPSEDYFYEGWVVRRGENMSVISTGALEYVDGEYVNAFMSSTDFLDHTFYVLTLEPNDGDPAPAEHILEGTMK